MEHAICKLEGPTYRQPKPPESCKPATKYNSPKVPLDNKTVYKVSYIPHKITARGDCKTPGCFVEPEYKPIPEKIDGLTTFKLSYLYPACPLEDCRSALSNPPRSHLGFWGKFNGITTHKADYIAKPYSKRTLCHNEEGHFPCTDCPISGLTTHQISYLDPTGHGGPATLLKPKEERHLSKSQLDPRTTYKLSYVPYEGKLPDRDLPWAKQRAFKTGGEISAITTYLASYLPPGEGSLSENACCL